MLSAASTFNLQKEKLQMPYDEVLPKFKKKDLHAGSPEGPVVKDKDQAVAIMLNEKRKAQGGKKEYQSHGEPHGHDDIGNRPESMGEKMRRLAGRK